MTHAPERAPGSRRLTIDDIYDLRAYERERDDMRDRVIALKRRRRVGVGPIITLVFENRDTVRFQVQEMARAERMLSDEAILHELDVYNPLIPEPGELSATLFIELTTEADLRYWLPRLVGVEKSVELRLGQAGPTGAGEGLGTAAEDVVRCQVEGAHADALTREDVTAAVHYVRFTLTGHQVDLFEQGPVTLAVAHPAYNEATELPAEVRAELLRDLRA
jgi:hypothetical protein